MSEGREPRHGRIGGRIEPAFVSGTSSEFLGRKPLPRATRLRPLVFILGPVGVGKSAVARRLLDGEYLHVSDRELLDGVTDLIRNRAWDPRLLEAPRLMLDGPCFLPLRPSFAHSVRELLRLRVDAGQRTIVTEAQDGSPLTDLVDVVPPERRATVLLRFPVGRGRRRYAVRVCQELGMESRHARRVVDLEPWTYDLVRAALLSFRDGGRGQRR